MAIFDSVPKQVYTDLQQRYDALLEKYHALRMQGASLPHEPRQGRVVPPQAPPEETAAKRMHDKMLEEMVETSAQQLAKASGRPLAETRKEVEKMREIALGGSVADPPL